MKLFMDKLFWSLTLATVFVISLLVLSPRTYADCLSGNLSTKQAIECGSNGASGNNQTPDNAATNLDSTIASVVNLLSLAVGIVAVIMIIIAGFRYVTSGGKDESVKGAKNTILYAVIGLVIVALAQVIVHFVIYKTTTGADPNTPTSNGSTGAANPNTPTSNGSTGGVRGGTNTPN